MLPLTQLLLLASIGAAALNILPVWIVLVVLAVANEIVKVLVFRGDIDAS